MFCLFISTLLIIFIGFTSAAYSGPDYPTQESVTAASTDILQLIESNGEEGKKLDLPFIAGFVRLAFHDCVGAGGCDGCIDHTNPDNGGLQRYTNKLDEVYNDKYSDKMSRADFYAFASIVALEKSTSDTADTFDGRATFKFGRQECLTSPVEDVANDLPSSFLNIDDVLDFFDAQFSFTADEVVALLGAHTLGRAREENSGFEGRWVKSPKRNGKLAPTSLLDNTYYTTFIVRQRWKLLAKTFQGVTKTQWQAPNETVNTEGNRDRNQPNMLLNVDMCLAHNFTVIDTNMGNISCDAQCSNQAILPCCDQSSTYAKAAFYADDANNAAFIVDFTAVFHKMIHFNTIEVANMRNIAELELSDLSQDLVQMFDREVDRIIEDLV